jgi:hypothetical protein
MGYNTIEVDPDSQKLCTIVTTFGKYIYFRLPMVISGCPDIFQQKMSEIMQHLEFVCTYLDYVFCVSSNFEYHIQKLETILKKLSDH